MSQKLSSGFVRNEFTFTEDQLRGFCYHIAGALSYYFVPIYEVFPAQEISDLIDNILKEDYGLGQAALD